MLPIRLVLFAVFTLGAIVYGVWTRFGWPAGIGAAVVLLVMLGLIFGVGRREGSGSALREMREKAAKRWTCRTCGAKCAPKSTFCPNCGSNL